MEYWTGIARIVRCIDQEKRIAVRRRTRDRKSHCTGGFRYVSYALGTSDIGRIDQHGNPNGLGHQLVQKCQPLCPQMKKSPQQRLSLYPLRLETALGAALKTG